MNLTEQLKAECAQRNLTYVGFRGDPRSQIWVVGEAPGEEEERSGLPFVGVSGREQDRMLSDAGLGPTDVCFTNPYKVRPPGNDLDSIGILGISPDLYERQFLEELRAYRPTIIVAAGAVPMRLLCPQTAVKKRGQITYPIGKWRGSLLTSPYLQWPHYVIPVQHPAYVLREWSERQVSVLVYERAHEEWKHVYKHGVLNPLPERSMLLAPSFPELQDALRKLADQRIRVSVDIETLWQRKNKRLGITVERSLLYTIALAESPLSALSFCFWDYQPAELLEIYRLLHCILRNNRQIGQNYISFDCHYLATIGLEPDVNLVDDTLVQHHALYPEMEHSLAFQTMQYTREPYYKDEGHQWLASDDKRQLLRYNAKDAAVTSEVMLAQEEEFAS